MSENETKDEKVTDLPTKSATAAAEARQQAEVYDSLFSPQRLVLDDGSVIIVPPHPNLRMFDDDAQAAYERLEFELESYDRHPDVEVPEQKIYDKHTKQLVTTLPPTTQPGALKTPHRKDDKLLDPPYSVQVVQIALGEEDYARLRAGKVDGRRGSQADVWRIWNSQGKEVADRRESDPKSGEGSVDLEAVSSPDSE